MGTFKINRLSDGASLHTHAEALYNKIPKSPTFLCTTQSTAAQAERHTSRQTAPPEPLGPECFWENVKNIGFYNFLKNGIELPWTNDQV